MRSRRLLPQLAISITAVPERSGSFLRGDIGVTVAVHRIESRLVIGIDGKDEAAYAALSIGVGFL